MFNTIQLRFLFFLIGCIGSRLFITYIAYKISIKFLPIMGLFALIPIIGWINIIFFHPRETGLEVFGGKIWWKNLRPIHLILWILFSILAFSKNHNSWIVLAIDTFFGLVAFLQYHWFHGSFTQLF